MTGLFYAWAANQAWLSCTWRGNLRKSSTPSNGLYLGLLLTCFLILSAFCIKKKILSFWPRVLSSILCNFPTPKLSQCLPKSAFLSFKPQDYTLTQMPLSFVLRLEPTPGDKLWRSASYSQSICKFLHTVKFFFSHILLRSLKTSA